MKIRNRYRTHTCGELRASDAGKAVTIAGFFVKGRKDGFDLRDRHGSTRVVLAPSAPPAVKKRAEEARPEDVLQVAGEVAHRVEPDPLSPTGDIFVVPKAIAVLSTATPLPPDVGPGADPFLMDPDERLRWRYLDLRRPAMQKRLATRFRFLQDVRSYLAGLDFIEVETPLLARYDAEQAAAFFVPQSAGRSFALPQSPQLYKQLLMVAGQDRYFQIAKCFRNERRLTADRQPEFTALDMEMAYVDEEDIYPVVDGLMAQVWQSVLGKKLATPVRRLTWEQAVLRYGTDRPDTRFGLEIEDATVAAKRWPVKEIQEALGEGGAAAGASPEGGACRVIRVPEDAGRFEKGFLEGLPIEMRRHGEAFVTSLSVIAPPRPELPLRVIGRIAAQLDEQLQRDVIAAARARAGDTIVIVAAPHRAIAAHIAGQARLAIGRALKLIDRGRHELVWVHQFPFFEYDPLARGYTGCRHPFTQPLEEDVPKIGIDRLAVRTKSYDLVLDGHELGAGSIRNHDLDLQQQIFDMFEYPTDEVGRRFGFVFEAYRFGVPPHGGLSIGLDRLLSILLEVEGIAEVIAFPKAPDGSDPMVEAPSPIDQGYVRAMLEA